MSETLCTHDIAPDFVLPTGDGDWFCLASRGRGPTPEAARAARGERGWIVDFYPKDDTPGCTTEACDFTDALDAFAQLGADVVGISPDSAARHARFAQKHDLRVTLLADEAGDVARAWKVWRQKSLYGRAFEGIVRSTFLVAPDGTIARVWDAVKVRRKVRGAEVRHVDEVRDAFGLLTADT